MKYEMAYSILVHENPEFFDFQLSNIFSYNKNKDIYIIVHFNSEFWNKNSLKLQKICHKYNVKFNTNKYSTSWSSSQIFDAIISNIDYLLKNVEFKYYTMISSSELFVNDGLIDLLNSLNFDMIHYYSHKHAPGKHCERDMLKINKDQGLKKFLEYYKISSFVGFDFGRILNYKYTNWLFEEINKFWKTPITPGIKNYSMSECVINTVLSVSNLKEINNIPIVRWYNEEDLIDFKKNENVFIAKHVPRRLDHKLIKQLVDQT
jgi:hypothetical protein